MSWLSYLGANSYAVAKAAEWSLTNGIRLELAAQGTLVSGVYLSATDMMAGWDIPKNDPADVVRLALDGIEADRLEIIADKDTADAKAALSSDPGTVYATSSPSPQPPGQRLRAIPMTDARIQRLSASPPELILPGHRPTRRPTSSRTHTPILAQ
jgi:NAD(P)-dependent dehydrogenase (short-subunit alcohol dehydrogenase family)